MAEQKGGWGSLDRPGSGIKPSTWPKPDIGGAVRRFLEWYADKLMPVAEGIRGMLDSDKPQSIEEAVERYKNLPEKAPPTAPSSPPSKKGLRPIDKSGLMD